MWMMCKGIVSVDHQGNAQYNPDKGFQGGEVFRSGCCFYRGRGKIFYFRPGHETYPIFHQPEVLRIMSNAVFWAAPVAGPQVKFGHFPEPLEQL